jgi:hypothetical protein
MPNSEKVPTAPPSPSVREPSPVDVLVDGWFVETFHNIGLPTPQFNRFSAARDDLKTRLRAATNKE